MVAVSTAVTIGVGAVTCGVGGAIAGGLTYALLNQAVNTANGGKWNWAEFGEQAAIGVVFASGGAALGAAKGLVAGAAATEAGSEAAATAAGDALANGASEYTFTTRLAGVAARAGRSAAIGGAANVGITTGTDLVTGKKVTAVQLTSAFTQGAEGGAEFSLAGEALTPVMGRFYSAPSEAAPVAEPVRSAHHQPGDSGESGPADAPSAEDLAATVVTAAVATPALERMVNGQNAGGGGGAAQGGSDTESGGGLAGRIGERVAFWRNGSRDGGGDEYGSYPAPRLIRKGDDPAVAGAKMAALEKSLGIGRWTPKSTQREILLRDLSSFERIKVSRSANGDGDVFVYDGTTRYLLAKRLGIPDTDIPVWNNGTRESMRTAEAQASGTAQTPVLEQPGVPTSRPELYGGSNVRILGERSYQTTGDDGQIYRHVSGSNPDDRSGKLSNLRKDLGIKPWMSEARQREILMDNLAHSLPGIQVSEGDGVIYFHGGNTRYALAKQLGIPDREILVHDFSTGVLYPLSDFFSSPDRVEAMNMSA